VAYIPKEDADEGDLAGELDHEDADHGKELENLMDTDVSPTSLNIAD
jgi:hypothetical protein